MARLIADSLWLCIDCTMLTANATLGNEDTKADEAHAERMVTHLEPWREHTAGRHPAACLVLDDGSIEFSSRPCDGCGISDAGSRQKAALIA